MLGAWILRTAIFVALAHRHNQVEQATDGSQHTPTPNPSTQLVSILIPACNEDATIRDCLLSEIQSNYSRKEIIVINDGSRDSTSDHAHRLQANQPETSITVTDFARNKGSSQRGPAPSQRRTDCHALRRHHLCPHNQPHQTGHPPHPEAEYCSLHRQSEIADPDRFIPNIQSFEQTKIIQTFRRAQSHVNAVLILPGAVSAFRTSELNAIGGFSYSTLAEYADATMSLLRCGNRLLFTSAPIRHHPWTHHSSRATQAARPLARGATAMPLETLKAVRTITEHDFFLHRHGERKLNFNCSTFGPSPHRLLRGREGPLAPTDRHHRRLYYH